MDTVIKAISIQSPLAADHCKKVFEFLAETTGIRCEFNDDNTWQDRARQLDSGDAQIGWVCGPVYCSKPDGKFEILGSPVHKAPRYQDRPVYYSDVVVRIDSPCNTFLDLRGSSFGFNEPISQSGHGCVKHKLYTLGRHCWEGFFSKVVHTGAHLTSLGLILEGSLDCAAIDTTMLDTIIDEDPSLLTKIKIIDTLGPSPIPPWIISTSVPEATRKTLRDAFVQMHKSDRGKQILESGGLSRMAETHDTDYNQIRDIQTESLSVSWGTEVINMCES
eukprot:TRINITY_DN3069_c1_g1_i1.p1 TRINITY_DN3069_c1_g1~~TRINITY_DN3069_c1_g1_i1.p1  ORF type:complete len:276 (+),score=39.33 TRINITY_DN3069_c1_g1_i1:72-899(+)